MSALDTKLIKKPHIREKLSTSQISELTKCVKSPEYFTANHCYIQHPTKGKMKFAMFDYQKELLNVYNNYRYSIAMLARQTGKTTCAAAYLLWFAMFKPDSIILVAAHKRDGAQEIMQRIRYAYETLPDYIRAGVVLYNKGEIEFDNGSRILSSATTSNTGRGLSLSLIYLDEFAFVPSRIAEEFWTSISPTLSTGGKCIITSTPNQDNDQFAQIWRQALKTFDEHGNKTELGINDFKSILVKWDRHPDRDEKWAKAEEAKIGEEKFRREHNCEFITADDTLITGIKLVELKGIEPIKRIGNVRWYEPIKKDSTYIIGLDPSMGVGKDNAAVQVFELPELNQVAEWMNNKTGITEQIQIIKNIATHIRDELRDDSCIYYSVENNTCGEAALIAINEMGEDSIPGMFMSEPKKNRKGYTTSAKNKIAACTKLKNWIEKDKMKISSKALIQELKTYVSVGASFGHKVGDRDDLVAATLLIIYIANDVARFDDEIYDSIRDSYDEEDEYTIEPMPMLT